MSYCTRIQTIVDEADKPDLIPHEAASHISGCPECQSFADERAKLLELMASSARITVPVNFNALLNERLSRVKAQKASWLNSAGLLRLGSATAALAVALLAVQYSGIFSSKPGNQPEQAAQTSERELSKPVPPAVDSGVKDGRRPEIAGNVRQVSPVGITKATAKAPRDSERGGIPIFIVRDRGREVKVPMMPVSLGMQQQVLNSSGRQQPRSSDITY